MDTPSLQRLLRCLPVLLAILIVIPDSSPAQSIFRDRRDREPIIPNIVAPVGPGEELPPDPSSMPAGGPVEEGTEGEVDPNAETEDGIVAEPVEGEDADGEGIQAVPTNEPAPATNEEEVLNRARDASANRSTPGVVALMRNVGQLGKLEPINQTPITPPSNPLAGSSNARLLAEAGQPTDAQVPPAEDAEKKDSEEEKKDDPLNEKLQSNIMTALDARTFTFSIPAPRGQILDRNGLPLAQNKVVNYAAIKFPQLGDKPDETFLLKYAADRINYINGILGTSWDMQPKVIRKHYENRRWMPLLFSGALTKSESQRVEKYMVEGIELVPIYLRHYPNEKLLGHVIGYVGKRPPRATGPITNAEPIWGQGLGVQGLEKAYDEMLTGTPGQFSELYDEGGKLLRKDKISDPIPGNNIVTSFDLNAQRLAERLLRERSNRGAFVMMDVTNGDVLAMASYPSFNPNDFIPAISKDRYQMLMNDPEKPLFPRAYQGAYPPASTYKIASALAFLESGFIDAGDYYPCPGSWTIGSLTMRNWNSSDEGDMNVISAIARSCNTWFYEIAISVGGDEMASMSYRLGLGEKTGLPLPENAGFIPDNKKWIEKYRARLSDGDEANMSIGQFQVKCTPIQVARMMAAVGDQRRVMNPRTVTQVQDYNHNIVDVIPPDVRNSLNVSSRSLAPVRKGMYDVVNSSWGTGKSGYHKIVVAAKTGTGQWITSENRNVAWFAGYFPAKDPIYSFAILYEGNPGENVSGGKKAAPILSAFLNEYLTWERYSEITKRSKALRGDYSLTSVNEEDFLPPSAPKPAAAPAVAKPIFRDASPRSTPQTPSQNTRPRAPTNSSPRRNSLFQRIFGKRR